MLAVRGALGEVGNHAASATSPPGPVPCWLQSHDRGLPALSTPVAGHHDLQLRDGHLDAVLGGHRLIELIPRVRLGDDAATPPACLAPAHRVADVQRPGKKRAACAMERSAQERQERCAGPEPLSVHAGTGNIGRIPPPCVGEVQEPGAPRRWMGDEGDADALYPDGLLMHGEHGLLSRGRVYRWRPVAPRGSAAGSWALRRRCWSRVASGDVRSP